MSITSDREKPKAEPSRSSVASTTVCPRCGSSLSGRAVEGLCGRCLLEIVHSEESVDSSATSTNEFQSFPHQLGRYTLRRKLGQGAMGAVYLAKDNEMQRLVALKVPIFGRSSEEAIVERFQTEIRAAAAIRHPNICPIYDVGKVDGTLFMTMAFIEGRPLSKVLECQSTLSTTQAVSLVRKLALALHAAHQRGVVHRDLKPANIMIDQRGEPIVMDFGLALRRDLKQQRVASDGGLVGTPSYMSPEQVKGKETTAASDLYGLGVILYELVTSQVPFDGDLESMLDKIIHEAPDAPSMHNDAVPVGIDQICLKAVAKEPEQRFSSADEMARVLTQFMIDGEASFDETPAAMLSTKPDRLSARDKIKAAKQERVLRFTVLVTLTVTLLLLAALGYFSNNESPRPLESQVAATATETNESEATIGTDAATAGRKEEDPVVNYVLGRYLCFEEGKWGEGLPRLARGADEELSHLARQDLAVLSNQNAASPVQLEKTASAWAAFARGQSLASTKNASTTRAVHWYQLAAHRVDDLERKRLRTKIDELTFASHQPQNPVATVVPDTSSEEQTTPATFDPQMQDPEDVIDVSAEVTPETSFVADVVPTRVLSPFEQTCFDSLKQVELRRQRMLREMSQLVLKRDLELPRQHLQASGDVPRLARMRAEVMQQLRQVNRQHGEALRMRSLSDDKGNREMLRERLVDLRREQAILSQRVTDLTNETDYKQQLLSDLPNEMKATNKQITALALHGSALIQEAFWSLEPSGSLSNDAYEEMSVLLDHWLHSTEMHAAVMSLRALTRLHAGQLEKAVADADDAVRMDPSLPMAIVVRGYLRIHQGEAREAAADATQAVRLDGRQSSSCLIRGLIHRHCNMDLDASYDFRRAVSLASSSPIGHAQLAIQLASSPSDVVRDGPEALMHAKQACELSDRQSWLCLSALAAAYAELGEFEKAAKAQRQSLVLAPPKHRSQCELQLALYEANEPLRLH